MARHSIPRVVKDHLLLTDSGNHSIPAIQVGSEAWFAWLSQPAIRSFAFSSPQGALTARREDRRGTWYWYAYRSREGHLHKTYLGKSEDVTLVRLHEAATMLSEERAARPEQPDMIRPPQPLAATQSSPVTGTPSLHLLATKISMPPARLSMVTRPRLTQQMNAATRGALTLIVAPAGWGKTTLLGAWHTEASRGAWPLAWVSLDASDNDSTRFWTYVIAALNTVHPGVGETPMALLYSSSLPPIEVVLTSLLNALTQLQAETVLVLDDYHLIDAQPIHDALTYLVEHLPPNMHLVIASRSEPLLPLARLRARGALTELRAASLRFTAEETTAFLTEVMGLPLSAEQVTALLTRTEGWIAGLHLAALSLQGRDDVAGFIATFAGSHRYVVDYLIDEVLSRQPEEVQGFLIQTCILDRLSGPLCDAVRERDDSQARLAQVERSNLFLVSLDEERLWYRYHHLFAEVLRSHLRQTQPSLVPELHRRASRWYEQHKLFDEAVTHALAIPDVEYAADLIEQYARLTNFPSQFQALLGWLNRLPDAFVRTHPSLCIMHGITLMLTHQLEQASARIQDAERCLEEEMPVEQRRTIVSLIAAYRGNLARLYGDYEQSVPLAQRALELMPETEEMSLIRMFRPSTLVTAAGIYLVDGDMTPATEGFVVATMATVRALRNIPTTMRSISNLARLQLLQGRLRQSAFTIEQVMQLASGHGGLQALLNGADYFFILGDLLREWNQLDRAEQQLVQGMDLVKSALTADAEMIMRGYLALARLYQARGERTQALATLDAFAQLAYQRGFAHQLLAHGAAVRAQVELAQGKLEAAIRWAEVCSLSARDELSYIHEREYLTLVRVLIAEAQEHPTSHGNSGFRPLLSQPLILLDRLLEDAEPKARMGSVIEILILRALALYASGDSTGALTALGRALALAEPEGYIRLFLDEGIPMTVLLRQAYKQKITPEYTAALMEASGEHEAMSSQQHTMQHSRLIEPLTRRERAVLGLLVDGASNREIAERLVLSVNTVKKHVFNICSKLNVQSRAQVVVRARTLNLL
ncbi:MAG TPA: LuxR C-terminal-related transcriptional regulator [Ktedonobacteraceae bacterium]